MPFGILKGLHYGAPLHRALSLVEHRGQPFYETPQYMACHLQILQPCALGTLFQRDGLLIFLSHAQGLKEECRLQHHVLPLPPVGSLVVAEPHCQIPGRDILSEQVFRKPRCMLGYCARNRGKDPCGGPGGDAALMDESQEFFGQGIIEGEPSGYPPLFSSQHRGYLCLGQMRAVVKLSKQGRLFYHIPSPGMPPGQHLNQCLLLSTLPDLRYHRVPPTACEGLYPEVAI